MVTWGHRLEMSKVAPDVVVSFIRKHALKGPEKTHRNGQYDLMIKEQAQVISDMDDKTVCPSFAENGIEMKK